METETDTINAPQKVTPIDDGTTVNRVKSLIERKMSRTVGETVVAKPVYGDFFRVNWYAADNGDFAITYRISKSRFGRGTLAEDGSLMMEDKTIHRAHNTCLLYT